MRSRLSAKPKTVKAESSRALSGATIFLQACLASSKSKAALSRPAPAVNDQASGDRVAQLGRTLVSRHCSRGTTGSTYDPHYWGMQQPSIRDYLSHSLIARARQDRDFAQLSPDSSKPPRKPRLQDSASTLLAGGELNVEPSAAAIGSLRQGSLRRPAAENSILPKRQRDGAVPADAAPVMSLLSGATTDKCEEMLPMCSIGALPPDVLANIFSSVDFKSKLCALLVASRSMRESLQCGAAWDPLCFDTNTGRSFLRMLKKHDPLACFSADVARTKSFFPEGLFDVRRFHIILMDPEQVDGEQGEAADDLPQPGPPTISDPLDEACKRLRHYFTCVAELSVSNIEDFRMDYRFLSLRSSGLSKFGFVELTCCDANPGNPVMTYSLVARQDIPPRQIDILSALAENRARMQGVESVRAGTTFSQEEALYLAEHRSAFKSGDHFRFRHATFRAVGSHAVKKSYVSVVALLRERFPDQFQKNVDRGHMS